MNNRAHLLVWTNGRLEESPAENHDWLHFQIEVEIWGGGCCT